MAKQHIRDMESYNANTRMLPPLLVGDFVSVQNQIGNHPNCWEKTGTITETFDNRQYRIKKDGSNRVTLRDRQFLRKIAPVATPRCPILDLPYIDPKPTSTPLDARAPSRQDSPTLEEPKRAPLTQTAPSLQPIAPFYDQGEQQPPPIQLELTATPPGHETEPATEPETQGTPVRRSTRAHRPCRRLSPIMKGQWHEYSEQ